MRSCFLFIFKIKNLTGDSRNETTAQENNTITIQNTELDSTKLKKSGKFYPYTKGGFVPNSIIRASPEPEPDSAMNPQVFIEEGNGRVFTSFDTFSTK